MPKKPKQQKHYLITDSTGRELGEGHGGTRPQALLNLYQLAKVSGVKLSRDGKRLVFSAAPRLPNMGAVSFEQVA